MTASLLDELIEWLRIPSISTGGGDPAELQRAADWVVERVRGAGGDVTVHPSIGRGGPLVVGELPAAQPGAPTVIGYGHYDVQGAGDLALWDTPPFEPDIRDGRIYARGAADDKGNCLPLVHVACELARAGALPVNVRLVIEGEEEADSDTVNAWVRGDERGADCALVFDGGMVDEQLPALTLGLRGIAMAHVRVRTADQDLHSGVYGGTVLNAIHVLVQQLARVLPGPDGRVREELRAGVVPPHPDELASWRRFPPAGELLAELGARPVHPDAVAAFYERTGAGTSIDVNAIRAGEPRTVIPAVATATLSIRLAPDQPAAALADRLVELLREGAPAGAEIDVTLSPASEPFRIDPGEPAVKIAVAALERACGVAPGLDRSGGSVPVVSQLRARGIPTIVTGFVLPQDAFHAPNESYRLESLRLGERAARELYAGLAHLPV